METPVIEVGIMSGSEIHFTLLGKYNVKGIRTDGTSLQLPAATDGQYVSIHNKQIVWHGHCYPDISFEPCDERHDTFELKGVTIGKEFHWQRQEDQRFSGTLKFIVEDNKLTAINRLPLEEYLASVISSEMSATASLQLLKAHAVVSRSWLLAQIKRKQADTSAPKEDTEKVNDGELIRWYDRQSHLHFDVCADDHCQRYQGITRATTPSVREAVSATTGEVLTYQGGEICDTRFSKCCGGILEEYQYCWQNIRHPYLLKSRDLIPRPGGTACQTQLPDLTDEQEAEKWIRSTPDAFCHTADQRILRQVLNNYDQETSDFYRWHICYTQEELAALIHQRSGIDFGYIIDLLPLARGTSGRLWKLKIIGTRRSLIIGKELEIRRTLSPTHLYSSAFVIDKEGTLPVTDHIGREIAVPARFTITGAGWGHGVGLCQIGAAVMGEQGYTYRQILHHYYIGAEIRKFYE